MSRPIERLLAIDEMISRGDYPSIADFMRRFDIGERAVYADLRYLKSRFHAPLQFSKKNGGYFYTLLGWNLSKADAFTEQTERDLPPTKWLWQEMTRRFGKQATEELYQTFQAHMEYQRANQEKRKKCPRCGKVLQGGHRCPFDVPTSVPFAGFIVCRRCGVMVSTSYERQLYCKPCSSYLDSQMSKRSHQKQRGSPIKERCLDCGNPLEQVKAPHCFRCEACQQQFIEAYFTARNIPYAPLWQQRSPQE